MNSGEQELAAISELARRGRARRSPVSRSGSTRAAAGWRGILLALAGGRILSDAAEAALADDSNFDLTGNIAGLNRLGLVRDIVLPEPKSCQKP